MKKIQNITEELENEKEELQKKYKNEKKSINPF